MPYRVGRFLRPETRRDVSGTTIIAAIVTVVPSRPLRNYPTVADPSTKEVRCELVPCDVRPRMTCDALDKRMRELRKMRAVRVA